MSPREVATQKMSKAQTTELAFPPGPLHVRVHEQQLGALIKGNLIGGFQDHIKRDRIRMTAPYKMHLSMVVVGWVPVRKGGSGHSLALGTPLFQGDFNLAKPDTDPLRHVAQRIEDVTNDGLHIRSFNLLNGTRHFFLPPLKKLASFSVFSCVWRKSQASVGSGSLQVFANAMMGLPVRCLDLWMKHFRGICYCFCFEGCLTSSVSPVYLPTDTPPESTSK